MWIITAISREPFKRPLLVLMPAFAFYYILMSFLAENFLTFPLTYALTAAIVSISWPPSRAAARGALAALISYLLARYFLDYFWLFIPAYSLVIGFLLFPEKFRIWKWAIVSVLLFVSFWAITIWRQILLLNPVLPAWLSPAVPGCLFGFSLFCTFLFYQLEKDRIQRAYDRYQWRRNDAASLAKQTMQAYMQIQKGVQQEEIIRLAENTIYLCNKFQTILDEVKSVDSDRLEGEISEVTAKIQSSTDSLAKRQYEQALQNKIRQKEHHKRLNTQRERTHAQILNYLSGLENIALAYASRNLTKTSEDREVVEMFLNVARMQAESAAENAEAYERLSAS